MEIQLRNVSKTIKGSQVLNNIDLKFHEGRIYGLRGKNGCGKTMLMRAICGLLIPTQGEVIINGKILHHDIEFPQSIGALIENPSFLSNYTGYRNLEMLGALAGNITKEDIILALERVGLDPLDKRTYRKYSLGMKQKLGIANAILGEPDIIVLDEPINALDEDSVILVKTNLENLCKKGKIIITACHDKEELEYLSDEIIVLQEGRVVERLVKNEEKMRDKND